MQKTDKIHCIFVLIAFLPSKKDFCHRLHWNQDT